MRTVSVSPIRPTEGAPEDLDGRIVDGVESLRQRVVQAFRFRLRRMVHRPAPWLRLCNTIIGHRIPPALAATALANVVRDEGGAEILSLENMQYSLDRGNRTFSWSVLARTIYGPMPLSLTQGV